MRYDAYKLDKFKFLGLEMSGSKVLARISESDYFSCPVYTQDEVQVHDLLKGCVRAIQSGEKSRKVRKNYEQLLTAFNTIRTYKAQNGISLDVPNPCV